MAVQAYVKVKGSKQGQFKGETTAKAPGAGAIPIIRFASTAQSPRDIATGQASGKRQWQPLRITKTWGAASPQLLNAMLTNEVLANVVCEFWRSDPTGKDQLHYRVTLQNATVSTISTTFDSGSELEDIEFTFQSISVEDVADKTMAADNFHDVLPAPTPTPAPTPQPVPIREPVRPVLPG